MSIVVKREKVKPEKYYGTLISFQCSMIVWVDVDKEGEDLKYLERKVDYPRKLKAEKYLNMVANRGLLIIYVLLPS